MCRQPHAQIAGLHQPHRSGVEDDGIQRSGRRGRRSKRTWLWGPGLLGRLWLWGPGLWARLWRRPGLRVVYRRLAEGCAGQWTALIGLEKARLLCAEWVGASRSRRGALRGQACPAVQAEGFVCHCGLAAVLANNHTGATGGLRRRRRVCWDIGRGRWREWSWLLESGHRLRRRLEGGHRLWQLESRVRLEAGCRLWWLECRLWLLGKCW